MAPSSAEASRTPEVAMPTAKMAPRAPAHRLDPVPRVRIGTAIPWPAASVKQVERGGRGSRPSGLGGLAPLAGVAAAHHLEAAVALQQLGAARHVLAHE